MRRLRYGQRRPAQRRSCCCSPVRRWTSPSQAALAVMSERLVGIEQHVATSTPSAGVDGPDAGRVRAAILLAHRLRPLLVARSAAGRGRRRRERRRLARARGARWSVAIAQPGPRDGLPTSSSASRWRGLPRDPALASRRRRVDLDAATSAPTPRRARRRRPRRAPRRPSGPESRPALSYNPSPMIDREQVLHVARLARLELSERRGRAAWPASSPRPRPHREDSASSDLDGVPPTSHVVDVDNALRPDEPRPSLPREVALATRPTVDDGGFGVPSPGPDRHERRSSRSPAAGGGRRRATGDLDAGELFEAYRARAAADDLNAFTWVADGTAPATAAAPRRAARRRPARRQGPLLHRGRAEPGRLEDPRGLPPAVHRDRVAQAREAGAPLLGKTNQDEFAMGSSNENSAFGPVLNPWDRDARAGRLVAAAAPPRSPPALAPWAIGTDTGGSIRQPAALCGIVGLKPTYGAICRYGMIAFASSLDQAGPLTRDVTDAALLLGHMVGRDPRDSTSRRPARGGRACRRRSDLDGMRLGVPEELTGEGIEPGVHARRSTRRSRSPASSARPSSACRCRTRRTRSAAYYLIAPGRGVLEPRALRRRPLRPARRRRRPARHVHADARRRLRRRGQAPHHARHLRAVVAATTTPTTAARSRCARRSPRTSRAAFERFDFIVTPTAPSVAFELGAKTDDPLAMYLNDYCTVPMSLAGIPAISIPNGLSEGLPVGFQLAGPAFSENRLLDAAYALEQAIGFDVRARGARDAERRRLRARHRPGDPRPARDADEDVLRLRAVASASRRTRTPARSASACPARCRSRTRRRSTTG